MVNKICSRCKVEKILDDFYKCKSHKDGHSYYCKRCHDEKSKLEYLTNPKRKIMLKLSNKKLWDKLKDEAFQHYGGYICVCCGELTPQFLSIDHIDGGGHQHRKSIGNGHFYRWLRDNHYPEGFQILCMNCNFGKRMNHGICPHKEISVCQEKYRQ